MTVETIGQNQISTLLGRNESKITTPGQGQQTVTSTSVGSQADKITLTGRAALIQLVEEAIQATPVVDQQHVKDVRDALQQGVLEFNPARIAQKIIRSEEMLFGRASG